MKKTPAIAGGGQESVTPTLQQPWEDKPHATYSVPDTP